ncbi:MAG: glycine zipper domain-containing protein [Planctomycetaceae bacterium]
MRRSKWAGRLLAAGVMCAALTGCESMNHMQKGTGLGAATGAITGAIIGHQTGHRDAGALIGGLLGGVGGGLVGHNMDVREERDAAVAHAAHQDRLRTLDARAMTNADVVYMAQNGLSDQIIIGNIRHRGGRFDTRPEALVELTRQGVSEPVIAVIQQSRFETY